MAKKTTKVAARKKTSTTATGKKTTKSRSTTARSSRASQKIAGKAGRGRKKAAARSASVSGVDFAQRFAALGHFEPNDLGDGKSMHIEAMSMLLEQLGISEVDIRQHDKLLVMGVNQSRGSAVSVKKAGIIMKRWSELKAQMLRDPDTDVRQILLLECEVQTLISQQLCGAGDKLGSLASAVEALGSVIYERRLKAREIVAALKADNLDAPQLRAKIEAIHAEYGEAMAYAVLAELGVGGTASLVLSGAIGSARKGIGGALEGLGGVLEGWAAKVRKN
jgi:hypothetical protein